MNLEIEIVSPEGLIFPGQCYLAVIPAVAGAIGVMVDHESFLSSLKEGEIKIFDQQQNILKSFSLMSGFAEMQDHKLIILVN